MPYGVGVCQKGGIEAGSLFPGNRPGFSFGRDKNAGYMPAFGSVSWCCVSAFYLHRHSDTHNGTHSYTARRRRAWGRNR